MKHKWITLIVIMIMIIFVAFPLPMAGLTLRFYFSQFEGEGLKLYYSTASEPFFSEDKTCVGEYDEVKKMVALRLDAETAASLRQVRIDFPETEQLVMVYDISLSSGGIVRKRINPCDFFDEKNLGETKDIKAIDLAVATAQAYISTDAEDPYFFLSDTFLSKLLGYRSRYRLTRGVICILLLTAWRFYKKKFFL